MAKWISNLRHHLAHRPVTVLHGNVRDIYVDEEGHVYQNLTTLLRSVASSTISELNEFVLFDCASGERRGTTPKNYNDAGKRVDAFAGSAPDVTQSGKDAGPTRILAKWNDSLRTGTGKFYVLHYLDKLVEYKKHYTEEEQTLLLWLEKIIENITDGNRLVLVALRDSMVPIELYAQSPKTGLFVIPSPGMEERMAYLQRRIHGEANQESVELLGGLTDGLSLYELHPIADEATSKTGMSRQDTTRLVNKYRIGEQEDYWGQLSIDRLKSAFEYFVDTEGVKGQDEAIGRVIDALCLARAGLSGVSSGTLSKPKGVLFFAGPTGVGKTLVAKKLAKFLFSSEDAFLRFDMSEYKEEHTVSKLIGSPPGYVGFEEGGVLTGGVSEKPFSVVLFDEIEKAHPKILDLFLQLLDDGRLTDSRGQTVYFTETLIIFTSNIGTRSNDSRGMPVDENSTLKTLIELPDADSHARRDRIQQHFARSVERFFEEELSRPELLNRIGNRIVPFNPIDSTDVQYLIVESHLNRICGEIHDRYRKYDFHVHIDHSVVHWIVETHGERIRQFGGRGITNVVEDELLIPIARRLLQSIDVGARSKQFKCFHATESDQLNVAVEPRA